MTDEFAEFDIPEAEVDRAFAEGEPVELAALRRVGFACPHVTITSGVVVDASSYCGCRMAPLYATA